ncbi:MAG: DUF4349 domain-containing protein [Dehalococcoidales bacterium]|nr:DUF4349 domain-containing protein [Dehalococcoidales bacterium]
MKRILFGLLVLVIISLLIGAIACGGSSEAGPYKDLSSINDGVVVTQAPVPTITATRPTVVPATTTPPKVISPESTGGTYYDIVASTDRMVIRTAYLILVVDDVSDAMQQINSLAENFGGFVVNSNLSEDSNRLYAYISFRVDSARFNDTLQSLRNLAADVKTESTTGQDVTEQYTDLQSRLRNLEASEAQLLELMNQAGTVTEILTVQRELTNTREDIELIKGQMLYLEQSAAMALFTVTLEQSKLIVEFTADSRTVKEGSGIQFYASVSGGFSPYTYEWDFGDGDTSTDANPFHVYHESGDFTVTLKVTDDKGTSETYTREDYISVLPGWGAGTIVESAWNALVSFFRGLGAFFIGLGIFSPIWIIILVILYFAWWRRRKKKNP